MTDTTQPASQPVSRDGIALKVINLAGIGIAAAGVAVFVTAWFTYSADDPETGKQSTALILTVFNTIVPVFGTWVGTVIAFYFARENFESAAKSTRELVGQLGDEKLKQIKVQDAWTPVDKIKGIEVAEGEDAKKDFQEILSFAKSEKITRAPIWTAGKVVRYIVHRSALYQYEAERDRAKMATLADFLASQFNDEKKMSDVVGKLAWLPRTATLADAKAKMEGTPDCQDVFITENGRQDEPILGWITNIDIARKSKA